MKKIILFLMGAFLLTSCSKTFYQVYDVETEHLKKTSNALIFTNNDCCIYYDLWNNNGSLSFIFENTSNRDLYLDLSRSFFINNGLAFDYYEAGSQTSIRTRTDNIAAQKNVQGIFKEGSYLSYLWNPIYVSAGYSVSANKSESVSQSYTKIFPKYVCIPPKSSKIIRGFNISTYIYIDKNNRKFNYPRKESNIIRYNIDTTPLKFRNRLVYSYIPEHTDDFIVVDNEFWIKSMQNFSRKSFVEVKYYNHGTYSTESFYVEKQKAPNKFYNIY